MSVKKTSQILKLKLKKSKLAIIDIGSNSVRLVIYPDSGKYPYPLFNERINCRLGETLFETGKLSTRSISRALKASGVVDVLTGEHIAKDKIGGLIAGWAIRSEDGSEMKCPPNPPLAKDNVNFVGDPIAVVFAPVVFDLAA